MTDLDKKFQKEITSGVAALVLLSVLVKSDEPMYGYQIAKLISAASEDEPLIKQGALYPVLRSLEGSGLLESTVEPSVSGPPRRYYAATEEGQQTLSRWAQIWADTTAFVNHALQGVSYV